jgi:hypothetical protein
MGIHHKEYLGNEKIRKCLRNAFTLVFKVKLPKTCFSTIFDPYGPEFVAKVA